MMNRSKRVVSVQRFAVFLLFGILSILNAQESGRSTGQTVRIVVNRMDPNDRMVDVGGRKLHCRVYGGGAPTVVLISGLHAPQTYWDSVIPSLSEKATVVTYDRPGYGNSETGGLPLHGKQAANDLHLLLEELGVPKPYLIVGHSYGGDIARLFTAAYPGDMGGLVLEDTQHEDILREQREQLKGRDLEILEEMVARMSHTDDPKTEMDYRLSTTEQLRNSDPMPQIPYVVITSGKRSKAVPPVFSESAREELIRLGLRLQGRLVKLIPGGEHIVAEGAGHNIHVEKPGVLLRPVVEMIDEINRIRE
jgi:pimeloyl-ACP methyl ester carboxylesterase